MSADQEMWTPLEAALAPFKELAGLNRQSVIGTDGNPVQMVLKADRCRVQLPAEGTDPTAATIEIGFALAGAAYAVHLVGSEYRRQGRWDFDRIKADISASLRSGALKPGESLLLAHS